MLRPLSELSEALGLVDDRQEAVEREIGGHGLLAIDTGLRASLAVRVEHDPGKQAGLDAGAETAAYNQVGLVALDFDREVIRLDGNHLVVRAKLLKGGGHHLAIGSRLVGDQDAHVVHVLQPFPDARLAGSI